MFNKKQERINALERENAELRRENELLHNQNLPSGCKPGPYCGTCQFAKVMKCFKSNRGGNEYAYVCAKNGVCKNYKERQTD